MSVICNFLFSGDKSKFTLYEKTPSIQIQFIVKTMSLSWANFPALHSCNGDVDYHQKAFNFFETIIRKLNENYTELINEDKSPEAEMLHDSIECIKAQYFSDPKILYGYVRDTISFEMEMLDLSHNIAEPLPESDIERIYVIMRAYVSRINSMENVIQGFEQYPQDPEIWNFMRKLKFLCDFNEVIFYKIIECLNRWKMHQKTFKPDAPFEGYEGLNLIQKMFDDFIIYIVVPTRNYLTRMNNFVFGEQMQESITQYLNLFHRIIHESVIYEDQPPQVLRTNTSFTVQMRLLITPNILNIQLVEASAKAILISEPEAKSIFEWNGVSAEIKTKSGIEQEIGRVYSNKSYITICFENLHLNDIKGIRKTDRKVGENVTEEKFALLFQCELNVQGEVFKIWKLSLPVVVIVHGSQDTHAWSTIFWDNYFTNINRVPFVVPACVTWSNLADALNIFVASRLRNERQSGRGLTQQNLDCLAEKLGIESPLDLVTWSNFAKIDLKDSNEQSRGFTFWKWFYEALKLLTDEEGLKAAWLDNKIIGFIQKEVAEKSLLGCHEGTFLLRFSDSLLGGLSITVCKESFANVQHAAHVGPWTRVDFKPEPLQNRIVNFTDLKFLYPNTPKLQAFGPALRRPLHPGYVQTELRIGNIKVGKIEPTS